MQTVPLSETRTDVFAKLGTQEMEETVKVSMAFHQWFSVLLVVSNFQFFSIHHLAVSNIFTTCQNDISPFPKLPWTWNWRKDTLCCWPSYGLLCTWNIPICAPPKASVVLLCCFHDFYMKYQDLLYLQPCPLQCIISSDPWFWLLYCDFSMLPLCVGCNLCFAATF